jgi:hypothetical protein
MGAHLRANPRSKKSKILLESTGYGGENVSQSPLKDKAFSTFQDENPPFDLPTENGVFRKAT